MIHLRARTHTRTHTHTTHATQGPAGPAAAPLALLHGAPCALSRPDLNAAPPPPALLLSNR